MTMFKTEPLLEKVRPSYKDLKSVDELGIKNFSTIDGLAKEFLISRLKVTAMLRDAKVWPVGTYRATDPETKKVKLGKPSLAYDSKSAKDAIAARVAAEASQVK